MFGLNLWGLLLILYPINMVKNLRRNLYFEEIKELQQYSTDLLNKTSKETGCITYSEYDSCVQKSGLSNEPKLQEQRSNRNYEFDKVNSIKGWSFNPMYNFDLT